MWFLGSLHTCLPPFWMPFLHLCTFDVKFGKIFWVYCSTKFGTVWWSHQVWGYLYDSGWYLKTGIGCFYSYDSYGQSYRRFCLALFTGSPLPAFREVPVNEGGFCLSTTYTVFLWLGAWLLFFCCSFLCGYLLRAAFISLESPQTSTMTW